MGKSAYQRYCELRDKHKLRDSDVAKGTGITKSTFSDWKAGRYSPKQDKLQKIADYFRVTIDYFTTGNENTSEDVTTLTPQEVMDVSRDAEDILSGLQRGDSVLLRFSPEDIDESDREYLRQSLISMFTLVKLRNKEKGNDSGNKEDGE